MLITHVLEGLGIMIVLISIVCLILGIPRGQDIHQKEGRTCPEPND
jgi:uncharacterized membrane protein YidH (DUF202 family)